MITHEQAGLIRAYLPSKFNGFEYIGDEYLSAFKYENGSMNHDALAQALDEYDVHYTTVETAELERLQALERKIAVFLEGASLVTSPANGRPALFVGDLGPKMIQVEMGDDQYCTSNDEKFHLFQLCGDAMRKAFELFEVPVEVKS